MKSYWLARSGVNHGLYKVAQLREMLLAAELLEDDCLCAEGTEHWLSLAEFVEETRKQIVEPVTNKQRVSKPKAELASTRIEKASQAQKDYMRSLGLPVPRGLTMQEARAALSAAIDGGARERTQAERREEQRVHSAFATVNGFLGYRGYGHPLKYVTKEKVRMLVDWLNSHYPRWADGAWQKDSDPFEVFDKWLCPAVAGFFPELVKTSYRHEFGPGQRWCVLR